MNASNIKAEVSAKEPWPRTLEKEVELSMGVVCTLNASIFNNGLQYHKDLVKVSQSYQAKLEPPLHKVWK